MSVIFKAVCSAGCCTQLQANAAEKKRVSVFVNLLEIRGGGVDNRVVSEDYSLCVRSRKIILPKGIHDIHSLPLQVQQVITKCLSKIMAHLQQNLAHSGGMSQVCKKLNTQRPDKLHYFLVIPGIFLLFYEFNVGRGRSPGRNIIGL
jgi:hypothetical protein